MALIRWIIGGLIGGAVGVLVWALIGYFAQTEVGWIAWGVGFLVGLGVRFADHLGDGEEGSLQGVTAAAMAVGSIVVAKFIVFLLLAGGSENQAIGELTDRLAIDDEAMIASVADEIVEELTERGQTVNWPPGMSYDEAFRKEHYSPQLWQQAETRWNQLSAEEQQKLRQARLMLASMLSDAPSGSDFSEFFSPWDLLWFALAAITAYKIGAGTYGDD